jgi:hypothetical protein
MRSLATAHDSSGVRPADAGPLPASNLIRYPQQLSLLQDPV